MYIEFEANKAEAESIIDILEFAKKYLDANGGKLNGLQFPGSTFLTIPQVIEGIRDSIVAGRDEAGSDLLNEVESLREDVEEKDGEITGLEDEVEDLEAQVANLESQISNEE